MLVPILIGNPQQEVVNFLAGDSYPGRAKSRQLWLLPLLRQSMLLLLAAVDKFAKLLPKMKLVFCGLKNRNETWYMMIPALIPIVGPFLTDL
ncbi:hypothetical protein Tco_0141348 [Tanacetum coccineum]